MMPLTSTMRVTLQKYHYISSNTMQTLWNTYASLKIIVQSGTCYTFIKSKAHGSKCARIGSTSDPSSAQALWYKQSRMYCFFVNTSQWWNVHWLCRKLSWQQGQVFPQQIGQLFGGGRWCSRFCNQHRAPCLLGTQMEGGHPDPACLSNVESCTPSGMGPTHYTMH